MHFVILGFCIVYISAQTYTTDIVQFDLKSVIVNIVVVHCKEKKTGSD